MDIREIAKRAKVSTATVSRAINRVPTVDPQLAKRVWKVVDELGYYPNTKARALVSGKSRIFGLVVSEITNPFFPEIVHTFEELAVQGGYEILLVSTVHDSKRMRTSVRRMIEQRGAYVPQQDIVGGFAIETQMAQHQCQLAGVAGVTRHAEHRSTSPESAAALRLFEARAQI